MLFHPSIQDPATTAASWWRDSAPQPARKYPRLENECRCEIAVIGGGYTGLSAALHLSRDFQRDVCLVDAAQPGWGASGRNGGFCCMGASMLSYQALIRRYGLAETRLFHSIQNEAVDLVRTLGTSLEIDFEAVGSGEYQLAHRASRVRSLRAEQAFLHQTLGFETQLYEGTDLARLGMAGPEFHAALHTPTGFGLHPLKYARGLASVAVGSGTALFGDSQILSWSKTNGKHRLVTGQGSITADEVILATNGYTPADLVPDIARGLLPALSAILVTRPMMPEELAAQGWTHHELAYDTRTLLHYFRLLPGARFLFGGRGGTSGSPAALKRRRRVLTDSFRALFPAWRAVDISHFWSGLVCIAQDRVPHLSRHPDDPSIAYALAYHGNGVAMATWMGRAAASMISNGCAASSEIPGFMHTPLKAFPLPALRLSYLRAAYLGYTLREALTY